MGNKFFIFLTALFFLYGCESATKQSAEISGSNSSEKNAKTVISNNEKTDDKFSSNETSTQSFTSIKSAEDVLEQKFSQIGTSVYFEYDKSTLNSESQTILRKQADFLRIYPSLKIIVEGHCDERGTREYNLALGDRRAVAVRDFLVASGINESRIKIISYGKEKPLVGGSNTTSWAMNRRAVSDLIQ